MPPRLTYILLAQNHDSKDNKACTCQFGVYGNLEEANTACPVQGHRYFRVCGYAHTAVTSHFTSNVAFATVKGKRLAGKGMLPIACFEA